MGLRVVVLGSLSGLVLSFGVSSPVYAEPSGTLANVVVASGQVTQVHQPVILDLGLAKSDRPTSCRIRLSGDSVYTSKALDVSSRKPQVRMSTRGMRAGTYDISVQCGRSPWHNEGSVTIVPQKAATTASCKVTKYGLSNTAEGSTTGLVVFNPSKWIRTDTLNITLKFKAATGETVATQTVTTSGLGPLSTKIIGLDVSPTGGQASWLTADATCTAGADWTEYIPLPGFVLVDDGVATVVRGTVTNTLNRTLPAGSSIQIVYRDQAANLTGGTSATLPRDLAPGESVVVTASAVRFEDSRRQSIIEAQLDAGPYL